MSAITFPLYTSFAMRFWTPLYSLLRKLPVVERCSLWRMSVIRRFHRICIYIYIYIYILYIYTYIYIYIHIYYIYIHVWRIEGSSNQNFLLFVPSGLTEKNMCTLTLFFKVMCNTVAPLCPVMRGTLIEQSTQATMGNIKVREIN